MNKLVRLFTIGGLLFSSATAFGQFEKDRDMQQFRYRDQRGINKFEALEDDTPFDGFKVRLGGAFAVQFQALDHSTGATLPDSLNLVELGNNFNLPTANLDIDVAIADGVRMHTRTYLSSRHHPESWVKGGYVQISKLDFIREGFLENIMNFTTIKVGLMEINYGDYHFRRSDNATAIYNPFAGNLILDAFNTEAGAELYFTPDDFLVMVGVTNGKLNQGVLNPGNNTPAFLAKLGYDTQLNEDLRLRLTGSLYTTADGQTNFLYNGDRAGSRYYMVMEPQFFTNRAGVVATANPTDNFTSGRFNPSFVNEVTAIMVNPFVKWKGLEFLGTFETTSGKIAAEADTRTWTQLHGELIYRFGEKENTFLGAKYNTASGDIPGGTSVTIDRIAFAGGWYMTKNMMLKAEYVIQTYDGFDPTSVLFDGEFNGAVVEAVISF